MLLHQRQTNLENNKKKTKNIETNLKGLKSFFALNIVILKHLE